MILRSIVRKIIAVIPLVDKREIMRKDGKQYLTRHYIFRKPKSWLPSIYLHCFHSSDEDPELHNHPWKHSISFILSGSYIEHKLIKGKVIQRIFKPGMINFIKANDYHRVDLATPKVWTLFISGSKNQSWGFLDIKTHKYHDFKEHDTYVKNRTT